MALQALGLLEALAVVSHLGEEPWGELWAGAGEGAKEAAVRMLGEELFDCGTIGEELLFQSQEHARAAEREQALGGGLRG